MTHKPFLRCHGDSLPCVSRKKTMYRRSRSRRRCRFGNLVRHRPRQDVEASEATLQSATPAFVVPKLFIFTNEVPSLRASFPLLRTLHAYYDITATSTVVNRAWARRRSPCRTCKSYSLDSKLSHQIPQAQVKHRRLRYGRSHNSNHTSSRPSLHLYFRHRFKRRTPFTLPTS